MSELSKEAQDFIRQQVESIANQPRQEKAKAKVKQEDKVSYFLMMFLGLAVVAVCGLYFFKPRQSQVTVNPSFPMRQVSPYVPYEPNVQSNDVKSYVDQKLAEVDQKFDRLDTRVWMLGLASNENAVASRKLAESMGRTDLSSKYLLLDSNWKFNKLPEFQQISDEDRRMLMRYVMKKETTKVQNKSIYEKCR